ncbi:MAG: aldose 1-epimerase [Hyphomonadaceae bacterium]|nr:aldose 1-epimerase [Hyphomonadaceae bacterium]
MSARVHLTAGAGALDLAPDLGAAITAWRVGGAPILRTADEAALARDGAGAAACFPMVPWVSRIRDGRFAFAGRNATLPPAPDGAQHSLHGLGWRTPWTVATQRQTTVTLAQTYGPPDWPWRAEARFSLTLAPSALRLDLTVANHDAAPMPAGLGFHPFFPRAPDTRLAADLDGVWTMDAAGFPAAHASTLGAWDWRAPDGFPGAVLDNVFTGWRGAARLVTPSEGRAVSITASETCDHLIVYAPPGTGFCCVEPVTSMTDAVNRAEGAARTGLRTVAPGGALSVWMQIDVAAAPAP